MPGTIDLLLNSSRALQSTIKTFSRSMMLNCLQKQIHPLWTKRCFFTSGSAVLKQDFQDVYPKNLLALIILQTLWILYVDI